MNLSKYLRKEDDSAENKFTEKYQILEDQEKCKKRSKWIWYYL